MSEYARVVTNSDEMNEFLDFVWMKGVDTNGQTRELIEDAIIHFTEDAVWCQAFDPLASVWVEVVGAFEGVRRPGKLVIEDIEQFRDYIDRFGDNTVLDTEERGGAYYITFDDEHRKTGAISAVDEVHVESAQDLEELNVTYNPEEHEYPGNHEAGFLFDTWFACDVSDITDVTTDGDTTEVRKYPISVDNGTVEVRVGDDSGWIETTIEAEGEGVASSVYAYGVDNIFSNLKGRVEVYLVEGGPAWIHQPPDEGDTDYTVNYLLAEDEDAA